LRRGELRVGLCRDRLVLARSIVPRGGIDELKKIADGSRVSVILSNHFVRYAVLPWTATLTSDEEWLAFAQDSFTSTYGSIAAGWKIRLCATGFRQAKVASAVDAEVLESLQGLPNVASIQPYLMAAFNSRRRALRGKTAWFVLQETGRLTLSLFGKGAWKLVRTRQAPPDWQQALADILDRESVDSGEPDCDSAMVCSEEELPAAIGRYRVQDITLPRGAPRSHVMALH
jgi:hypothetical protein